MLYLYYCNMTGYSPRTPSSEREFCACSCSDLSVIVAPFQSLFDQCSSTSWSVASHTFMKHPISSLDTLFGVMMWGIKRLASAESVLPSFIPLPEQ